MSDYYDRESQESIAVLRARRASGSTNYDPMGYAPSQDYSPSLHSSFSQGYFGGRGSSERSAQVLTGAQSTYGNHAVQRFVQRATSRAVQRAGDDDNWFTGWFNSVSNAVLGGAPDFVPKPVPGRGETGNVEAYNKQPPAQYDSNGVRITENEHVIARGNLEAMTHNPATGQADYGNAQYTNDATVRTSRETALNKTHGNRGGPNADNPRTKALKEKVARGEGIDYRRDVFEPSIENAKRARDATGATDLTDEAIHRGALAQDANLFDMQRASESGDIVKDLGSHVENFDIVEYEGPTNSPDVTPPPSGNVGSPGGSSRPGGFFDRTMRGAGQALQFLDTASTLLDSGFGIYNFATAKTKEDRVQAGADTVASVAGFLGPFGRMFSSAYSLGKLGDQTIDWTDTDVHGNPTDDHSLSKMVGEGWYDEIHRPGSLKSTFKDIGQTIWEGTAANGKGGIKGAITSPLQLANPMIAMLKAGSAREAAIADQAERQHEIQSRLFNIASRTALGGSEASSDDIATRIGQDRRLQFLLMSGGKCYE